MGFALKYPALVFGALYILLRLAFYYLGFGEEYYKILVSVNLLFIVLVIALTLYRNFLLNKQPYFPDEMKSAMRSISIYALVLTVFIFIFFRFIDTDFFPEKLRLFRAGLENTNYSAMPDDENPLIIQNLTKEEFVDKEMEKIAQFNSPFSWATFTLVGVMVGGLIYSLIMVLLRIKVVPLLFRKKF